MKTIVEKKAKKITIDPEFVKKILQPYTEDACYLKKAVFEYDKKHSEYPIVKGEFEIKESCYIDDTGHFNAVEFNICFNQLGYTYLGYCIKEGLIPGLEGFSNNDCNDFFEKQLSHFLIANIQSSYKRPINSNKFYGEIGIKSIIRKANCTFIVIPCNYYDDDEGRSFGEVTLAILHP
ncbi:FcoT family thioesterase [Aquimarina aquimarini]|uniref:FcoT family thioesterase n=1 Tax=Aquimarina aquimarini TaxID=1191734 RepID=UPI000D550FB9|nr:FcoT family thioesterase [Aquimarina aquimarini]